MKHLFVINPAAGQRVDPTELESRIRALKVDWEIVYTNKEGDGIRYARAAAETGEPVRIYGCGGDGTLNEIVNGAAGFENAAVTNVPFGSGNDYLKIFGKENKMRFADLEALTVGPQAKMDLIDCNGRLCIGVACAGVDARVAEDVDRYKRLPLIKGLGVFGASDGKCGACGSVCDLFSMDFNHHPQVQRGVREDECARLLTDFFQTLTRG